MFTSTFTFLHSFVYFNLFELIFMGFFLLGTSLRSSLSYLYVKSFCCLNISMIKIFYKYLSTVLSFLCSSLWFVFNFSARVNSRIRTQFARTKVNLRNHSKPPMPIRSRSSVLILENITKSHFAFKPQTESSAALNL